ncbi:MAG TPA: primosomal replication protein N [Methylophilaceae bacterium]|nr:primosomal replication protein N [Methylophilaceae bacterium]
MNKLELTGEVVQVDELRYTPAGIPLLSFVLQHLSDQIEAGMKRKIECDVSVIAMDKVAEQARGIKVGTALKVSGFLAKRSLKSTQLVLHINTIEKII